MATIIPFDRKPMVKAEVVAANLGCCPATVLRMARAGKIPAKRLANGTRVHWRFNLDDVVDALENAPQAAKVG